MRRFRIHNISGSPGLTRVWIPLTKSLTLKPGMLRGSLRTPVPSVSSSAVVPEAVLRRLVLFYQRHQLFVQPLDGGKLPDFLRTHPEVTAAPVVEPVVERAPVVVEESGIVEEPIVDEEPPADPLSKASKEVIDFLSTVIDAEQLRALLQAEESGKARKTVIKAIQDKLGEAP